MERHSDLDRLRAWVEGRLEGAERERLERELGRDPELAELAERLRDVFALTAAEAEPPPCRVTFADLERRFADTPRAWPRRAAAAALVLGAGGALWWGLRDGAAPVAVPELTPRAPVARAPVEAPVVQLAHLRATPEDVTGAAAAREPAWVPEVLANFDPRGPGGIAWLQDERTATFVSRAARRPVLVLGSLPGCPWCATLRAEVFSQQGVAGLADLYVPFEWDLGALPEKEFAYVSERRGYPLLEVWDLNDEIVLNFSGRPDATLFEEMLHQGLERAGVAEDAPDWADLRDWAARWLAADRARAEGRVSEAVAGWRELARAAQGNAIADEAAAALREVEDEANAALQRAREIAAHDLGAAERELESTLARYAGTAQAADLAAVLGALRSSGTFPTLVEAPIESR
jgi:hypothetical protein